LGFQFQRNLTVIKGRDWEFKTIGQQPIKFLTNLRKELRARNQKGRKPGGRN